MALRGEPGLRDPEAFGTFVAVLIGALTGVLLVILFAVAAVWREDAVGSVSRVCLSMIYTALIVAGQQP